MDALNGRNSPVARKLADAAQIQAWQTVPGYFAAISRARRDKEKRTAPELPTNYPTSHSHHGCSESAESKNSHPRETKLNLSHNASPHTPPNTCDTSSYSSWSTNFNRSPPEVVGIDEVDLELLLPRQIDSARATRLIQSFW